MPYQPIENYGVIGDLFTVALVGMDGSIDFMCYPHFDSPSVFAAILDDSKGGHFRLAPVLEGARNRQLYLPDTNVLLTRFLSEDGVAEISDFMPVEEIGYAHNLIRRAKTVRGSIRYRMECKPAFDYGRTAHKIDRRDGEVLFIPDKPSLPPLRLRIETPFEVQDGMVVSEFELGPEETAAFVLEGAGAGSESMSGSADYVSESFKATVNFWRRWVGQAGYDGRWHDMVYRSALTLKLLTSAEYGAIVAAPTFGLPEEIGGERNWDYRFTWIRDASFTLYGLIRLGYTGEAAHFMEWIEGRCRELGDEATLQTMYAIDGRADLTETILGHFEGYQMSSPVRIGNAAHKQLQLDIFGELLDSVYLYDKYGSMISHDLWSNLVQLIDWVSDNWEQPDRGIWEIRGRSLHFLYSRLMTWVAIDRAIRLAGKRSFPAPLARWHSARDAIHTDIHSNLWNEEIGAFVQHKGGSTLDASSLLMPLVRFISPTDPRWQSHMRAIERELVYDSLVYRYNTEDGHDGLMGGEGTFSMCSFWFVECLSRAGDIHKARFYFEKMLGYANHLGLYSEELGPRGEHLGNFPQAFTHLALISAAYDLNRRLSEAGWRG